jgi:hypothetical protein
MTSACGISTGTFGTAKLVLDQEMPRSSQRRHMLQWMMMPLLLGEGPPRRPYMSFLFSKPAATVLTGHDKGTAV